MGSSTIIAEVELYGTEQDDLSLLFAAAVLDAARTLNMTNRVSVVAFRDDDGVSHLGIAVPSGKRKVHKEAKLILDEALHWFNYKLEYQGFLLMTCH
jgi:predicted GH43/DUF377 family glycosyl hydrolase